MTRKENGSSPPMRQRCCPMDGVPAKNVLMGNRNNSLQNAKQDKIPQSSGKSKNMAPARRTHKKLTTSSGKSHISTHKDKNKTEVEEGLATLISEVKENKDQYIFAPGGGLIAAFFLWGFIPQQLGNVLGTREGFSLTKAFISIFSPFGLIIFLGGTFICAYAIHNFIKSVQKDYTTDDKRNYDISKKGVYGRAGWMTEEDRQETYYMAHDVRDIPGNGDILGFDDEERLYSLKQLPGLNKNVVIVGAPGSGKSAAIVINDIYQNITRGHSIIVTDSKGDLYKDTAYVAKKHGYRIRILNLKSKELRNSDGCDFFKILSGDDIDVRAQTLANTIIKNTADGERLDYWAKNEMNYLKALILFVADKSLEDANPEFKDNHTLGALYDYSSTHSLDEIRQEFSMLPPDHPATQAFNIFAQCEPKIQGQIANGMNIRLQTLGNKQMKRIVAADEIDLLLPMKKKCIYYVVISDTDTTFKFIATLFFAELFMEMCDYSDSLNRKDKKAQLPVTFILDEFANTGAIPEFDKKVTTVRSRKIGIKIILQDIGQLEYMYPNKVWSTILNGMAMKIYLSSNDPNTAKYFSGLLGIQTVRVENRKYGEGAGEVINTHGAYNVSEGLGKRDLMNPDELMNDLSSDDLIVCVSGKHPIMLHKFIHTNHPMDDERIGEDGEYVEKIPAKHKPKWRKLLEEEKAKEQAEIEQIKEEVERMRKKMKDHSAKETVKKQSEKKPDKPAKKAEPAKPKPESKEPSVEKKASPGPQKKIAKPKQDPASMPQEEEKLPLPKEEPMTPEYEPELEPESEVESEPFYDIDVYETRGYEGETDEEPSYEMGEQDNEPFDTDTAANDADEDEASEHLMEMFGGQFVEN